MRAATGPDDDDQQHSGGRHREQKLSCKLYTWKTGLGYRPTVWSIIYYMCSGLARNFAKIHRREISSDRVTRERRKKILTTAVNRSADDDDSGRSKLVGRACLINGVQCNLCKQRTENKKYRHGAYL